MVSRWLARLSFVSVVALGTYGGDAQALCVADPMAGVWKTPVQGNTYAQAEYIQVCDDNHVIECDETGCHPRPPRPSRLHLWGRCSPTACDWGLTDVVQDGIWKRGSYDQGFVFRVVFMRYDAPGNFVEIVTRNYYRDGRPFAEWRDYFRK